MLVMDLGDKNDHLWLLNQSLPNGIVSKKLDDNTVGNYGYDCRANIAHNIYINKAFIHNHLNLFIGWNCRNCGSCEARCNLACNYNADLLVAMIRMSPLVHNHLKYWYMVNMLKYVKYMS